MIVDCSCCCLPWTSLRILPIDRASHPDEDEVEVVGEKQMQAQVLVENDEVIEEQQEQEQEQEEGEMGKEGGGPCRCWTFLWY